MKVKVRFDLGRWLIGFKIGAQLHSSLISSVNWQTQYLSVYIGPLCVQLYRTTTVSTKVPK